MLLSAFIPSFRFAAPLPGWAGRFGAPNRIWLRSATQASDAWCRIAAHAPGKPWRRTEIQAFEYEPRWTAPHASDRERRGITQAAPLATSNAPAVATAMCRKARRLRKLGRSALTTAGRFGNARLRCAGAAAGLACACGAGSDARTELHGPHRPWSPAVGEYKAPQLMHPVTEAGLVMLTNVPDRSHRFPAQRWDAAPLPATITESVAVPRSVPSRSRASDARPVGDRFLAERPT